MPPLLNTALALDAGLALCRSVNELGARLCEADRSRFFGLGTVPLQDPDLAAGELSEVRRMGLHGVEAGSNVEGRSLGEDRFLGFFQEAERLRVPVFVHAVSPTFGNGCRPPPWPAWRRRRGGPGRRLAGRRRARGAVPGPAPGPSATGPAGSPSC